MAKSKKILDKVDRTMRKRIVAELDELACNPRHSGVQALAGPCGLMRVRVGDYRIIYTIHDGELIVLVVDIGHRGSVYKNL